MIIFGLEFWPAPLTHLGSGEYAVKAGAELPDSKMGTPIGRLAFPVGYQDAGRALR